jgi:hypothetical protein
MDAAGQRAARERKERHRRRVRSIAIAIVAGGLAAAAYAYWSGVRAQPSLEELLPGSERLTKRQVGMLYGHGGQIVYDWIQDARRPGTVAALIVIGAALAAFVFVRLSHSEETE